VNNPTRRVNRLDIAATIAKTGRRGKSGETPQIQSPNAKCQTKSKAQMPEAKCEVHSTLGLLDLVL
jgi:hypothetical protein